MSSPIGMALIYAFVIFHVATAMPGALPRVGPMPTSMGLMATAGISPRPTDAPGLNGLPKELRRRQNVQYPPPDNWCGFVDSAYSDPLSCSAGLTCVNSGAAFGCCTGTTGACTALYTTCGNFGDTCDAACEADPAVLKCSNALEPFCGTFAFPGGTRLYNCQPSAIPAEYGVELLADYYLTAISSTLAPSRNLVTLPSAGPPGSSGPPGHSSTTSSPVPHGGLSQGAIGGIAAAAAVIGAVILGIAVFFIVRSRKRSRVARANAAAHANNANNTAYTPGPPMQQQAGAPPSTAMGSYQSVPQQDQYTPPQPHQPAGYFPTPGSAPGTLSPSYTPSILSSPASDAGGQRQSYYKPPLSPTITEVDGTLGNPGNPSPDHGGYGNGGHAHPMEVDGTMGNPGVPDRGHGIQGQSVPGGSPSATEMDGGVLQPQPQPHVLPGQGQGYQQRPGSGAVQQHGASLSGPYNEGPYEMSGRE